MCKIRAADSQPSGFDYIGNLLRTQAEQIAGIAVGQYRIRGCHDAVLHKRIPALLKIRVAADVINHNKILVNASGQMSDRVMKSHFMKAPLLRIREKAFQILQRTRHLRLTMPLQDRNIDQKIIRINDIRDMELHTTAVNDM